MQFSNETSSDQTDLFKRNGRAAYSGSVDWLWQGKNDLFFSAHGYFLATSAVLDAGVSSAKREPIDAMVLAAGRLFGNAIALFVEYMCGAFDLLNNSNAGTFSVLRPMLANWNDMRSSAGRFGWSPFKESDVAYFEATLESLSSTDRGGAIFRTSGEAYRIDWALTSLIEMKTRAERLFDMFQDWYFEIDTLTWYSVRRT